MRYLLMLADLTEIPAKEIGRLRSKMETVLSLISSQIVPFELFPNL